MLGGSRCSFLDVVTIQLTEQMTFREARECVYYKLTECSRQLDAGVMMAQLRNSGMLLYHGGFVDDTLSIGTGRGGLIMACP